MARQNNRRLINLNTSASTLSADQKSMLLGESGLSFGEIAILHGNEKAQIFTKVKEEGDSAATLATFIDETAIDAKITSSVSGISADVTSSGVSGMTVEVVQTSGKVSSVVVAMTAGTVEAGNNNLVNGDAVNTALENKIAGLDVSGNTSDEMYGITVKVDETDGKVQKPVVTVESGTVEATSENFVLGKTVNEALENKVNGLNATKSGSNAGVQVEVVEASGLVSSVTVTVEGGEISSAETKVVTGASVKSAIDVEANRAKGVEGETSSLTTDAKNNLVAAINEVDAHADTNASAITILNANSATTGSVDQKIATAINELDATVTGKNASEQISVEVKEENGKLTSVSVTANKFDVDGAASTAESNAKAYTDSAKTIIDAYTVNGKAINGNPVLNGGDIILNSGYTKAESAAAITTADTVNVAIGKLEKGIEEAVAGGLEKVVSGNGISVTEVSNRQQAISVKVKENDNILSANENGLYSTLTIAYDSTNRKIQLKGIGESAFSEFDASAFVKDGMLFGQQVFKATAESQTITITKGGITQSNTFTNLTVGNQYLAMCFTNGEATGTTYSWDIVDVTSLVDVYTAGNGLQLSNGKFSIKLKDGNESSFLTVDESGLSLTGVQSAINTARDSAITSAITYATGYTDDKIAALDADVSDDKNGVKVQVVETNGVVSSVTVTLTEGSVASGNTGVIFGGSVFNAIKDLEGQLDARIDALESVSASTRIAALESVSADTRITTLESVSADTRIATLESVSADTRLDALEGFSARTEGFATSAQGAKADSAIQGVKVNDTAITPDSGKTVNVTAVTTLGGKSGAITLKAEASAVNTVQLAVADGGVMSATLNDLSIDCGTF